MITVNFLKNATERKLSVLQDALLDIIHCFLWLLVGFGLLFYISILLKIGLF